MSQYRSNDRDNLIVGDSKHFDGIMLCNSLWCLLVTFVDFTVFVKPKALDTHHRQRGNSLQLKSDCRGQDLNQMLPVLDRFCPKSVHQFNR